jgi:hypothetical protein
MQSFPTSWHFISLQSNYPPQHPVLKHPQSVPPLMSETKFHTHTQNHKITAVLYILVFTFFGRRLEDRKL